MADANATPWSLGVDSSSLGGNQDDPSYSLDDGHSLQNLALLGMKALQSGKVSLAQAKKNAEKMGVAPQGASPANADALPPSGATDGATLTQTPNQWSLSMAAQPQGAPNPLSMTQTPGTSQIPAQAPLLSPAQAYSQVAGTPGRLGAKASIDQGQTANQSQTVGRTQNLMLDPEALHRKQVAEMGGTPDIKGYEPLLDKNGQPLLDTEGKPIDDHSKPIYDYNKIAWDPTHPYQQEQAGIKQMQALNALQAQANAATDHTNLSPLLALADAFKDTPGFKPNLVAGYTPPINGSAQVQAGSDEVQKRLAALQQALSANDKLVQGGTQTSQQVQNQGSTQKVGAVQDTPPLRNQLGQQVTAGDKWFKGMQGALGDTNKSFQGAQAAYTMLQNATSVSDSNFRFALLHALNVGRITNQELQQEQGAKDLNSKIDQAVNTIQSGQLTDENRGQYLQLLGGIMADTKKFGDAIRAKYQTAGTNIYKLAPETVATQMQAEMGMPSATMDPNVVKQAAQKLMNPQAAAPATGMMRVRQKATGKVGTIPAANFNPSLYDQVQ